MLLNYKSYGNTHNPAIIIIHGLFGSLQNWSLISKELSKDYHVICVDCRNHGDSFHTDTMSYPEMATDIIELSNTLNIDKFSLIGHSMGGKIALTTSQLYPKKINQQIIIDISPKRYPNHHQQIIESLLAINLSEFKSRSEVAESLKNHIPNNQLRQFLIKNIYPKPPLKWQINLDGIAKSYSDIMDWPENLLDSSSVESLFIIGKKSNYIDANDEIVIKNMFSNCQIKSIDASHWVHAEQPAETIKQISDFIK